MAPPVTAGDVVWTRAQLAAAAAALAARLPPQTAGSHVAFAFERDLLACLVAMLATWSRGHAVALPADARRASVGPLLSRPEVVAFVHDTEAGIGIRVDVAEAPAAPRGKAALPPLGPITVWKRPADGGPGCRLGAEQLRQDVRAAADALQLHAGEPVLDLFTAGFPLALVPGVLAPLQLGCPLLLPRTRDDDDVLAALRAHEAAVVLAPTPTLRRFARLAVHGSPRLRAFTLTEPLDEPSRARLAERGVEVRHLGPEPTDPACAAVLAEAYRRGAEDAAAVTVHLPTEGQTRVFAVFAGAAAAGLQPTESPAAGSEVDVRVLPRLPRDGNGVLPPEAVLRCFGRHADGSLPVRDLAWQFAWEGERRFVGRTQLPDDFFAFAGHFAGYPVLSGAAQLHELVLPCLRRARPGALVRELRDVKFLTRIRPGHALEVGLTPSADGSSVEFEIKCGVTRASSGRLLCIAAADAVRDRETP